MEIYKETKEFEVNKTATKDGVCIFLENQDEINELYAILNFVPIADALASDFVASLYDKLNDYKTVEYTVFHEKLHNGIRKIRCQK